MEGKDHCLCSTVPVPCPGLTVTLHLPCPCPASVFPSVTLSRLDFISHEGSFGLSIECLEFPKVTRSRRCALKLVLHPQGEQGEDGKSEGPPGPPGDRVSPSPRLKPSLPRTTAKVEPWPPAVRRKGGWARGGCCPLQGVWPVRPRSSNPAPGGIFCCSCHSGPCG